MADHADIASEPLRDIDGDALEMFLRYARDAADSGENPLVEDHVAAGREECGKMSQLKRAGLLATVNAGSHMLIHFTGAGRSLASQHGVEIPT